MDKNTVEKLKRKLINQSKRIEETIQSMERNREAEQENNYPTELSNYDNHPAEIASELYELEHNLSLREHQERMLMQTREALKRIENGSYGICASCGKEITTERLEALPTAEMCKDCEDERNENVKKKWETPPNRSLRFDAGEIFNEWSDLDFEGMDQMNDLMKYGSSSSPQETGNRIQPEEFYTNEKDEQGVVDHMDKISNQEYKKQLPD